MIDSVERLFGVLHRRRRFIPAARPVKVNLGSGLNIAPQWVNIDGSLKTLLAGRPRFILGLFYPLLTDRTASPEQFCELLTKNTFFHYDLRYGVPMPDSSADFIYTSHFLHHLYRDEAQSLIDDCFRVLSPGGVLRIAVPDLEYIFSLYQKGERERALQFFFYSSRPRQSLSSRRYQYDFELLRRMLGSAGFDPVRRCSFRSGRTPDLELLDNRPEETLFIEADKPLAVAPARSRDFNWANRQTA